MTESRPPLPPFTRETALQKVRGAEDGWNSCDPHKVSLVYTPDSYWRNRSEFLRGREEIVAFLTRKWVKELDYRLIKELWAFTENRIAVRFAYEWRDNFRKLVSLLRQRELGVCRERADAETLCLNQRPSDQGVRAQIPLGSLRPAPCGTSRTFRPRAMKADEGRWCGN